MKLTDVPDHVYINLFRTTVPGAERVSSAKYRGRCPICGDSKDDKSKKRLYLLLGKNPSVCYCHNGGCNVNTTARLFFKRNFPQQWKNAVLNSGDLSLDRSEGPDVEIEKESPQEDNQWKRERDKFYEKMCVPLAGKLSGSAYQRAYRKKALTYCRKRKIPEKYFSEFHVCHSGEYSNRIIFPVVDSEGEDVMFQARALGDSKLRYHTKFFRDSEQTYFYRFYRVDPDQPVIITEGLIDCLYFKNGMSLMGASLSETNVRRIKKKFDKPIFVFDRDETGTTEVRKLMLEGTRCFVWPGGIPWGLKDIGDLVEGGEDVTDEWIIENSSKGAVGVAKLALR